MTFGKSCLVILTFIQPSPLKMPRGMAVTAKRQKLNPSTWVTLDNTYALPPWKGGLLSFTAEVGLYLYQNIARDRLGNYGGR